MRVLAIGECMAELAPSDTPSDFRLGFAGDTFNTAWYLARSKPDITVSYLSTVGTDAISLSMTDFMQQSGIDTRFVQIHPDRSIGLYLISLVNGERSFSYWRGQSAARTLADDPVFLDQAVAAADLIFFSGITLGILDAGARDRLLAALKNARAAGKTVAFDPNLRPRLWPSPDIMTKAIMDGAAVSDIALPSFEDEASWFNDPSPAGTADRYLAAGARIVVVKNGDQPVYFATADTRGDVPVTPVANVVDTTAAGDSFNAGFFARHIAGAAMTDSIAGACALSRQVIQHKGALVPIATD